MSTNAYPPDAPAVIARPTTIDEPFAKLSAVEPKGCTALFPSHFTCSPGTTVPLHTSKNAPRVATLKAVLLPADHNAIPLN